MLHKTCSVGHLFRILKCLVFELTRAVKSLIWLKEREGNGEGRALKGKSRKTYQNLITLQKYSTLQLERDAGYMLKLESKTDDLNQRRFAFENDPPYKLYNMHLPTESTIL